MSKTIYRMSGAGDCPRALSAEHLGYPGEPAPIWLEKAAREGKRHEDWIIEDLIAGGNTVEGRQKGLIIEYPTFILKGHIDGIISNGASTKLLEVKTMSQFEFARWMKEGFSGFPGYAAQLTCYMEATRLEEALYVVKNRSNGYEDKRIITEQPSSLDDIIAKLQEVTQLENLYPKEFNPNSLECKRCKYKALCAPEPKELTAVEDARLEHAVMIWREGKRQELQAKLMISDAKAILEEHTKATGIDRWRFNELAIVLIQVKETLAYPKKKLLETFTEEQLKPASEIRLPYEYIKVEDLQKEEENGAR